MMAEMEERLYNTIGNSEVNRERIAAVERLFNFPANKLILPKRVLVGEGVLTKVCRRKPKLRHFFLFNDILLYGRILVHRKMLRNPQFLDLIDCAVEDVSDNGIYRNGFSVLSPKKSFTVYSSTAEEKSQWMAHLKKCIAESRILAGIMGGPQVKHSPVWIPDAEATHCMVCGISEFTLVNRRHHCRHCGKVVCNRCSPYRWMLPYQGSALVRICRLCHAALQAERQKQLEQSQRKSDGQINYHSKPMTATDSAHFFSSPSSTGPTMPYIGPTFLGNASIGDDLDTDSDSDSEPADNGRS
ncbi:unnamed protein product [Calicophoron daubneyi]|uniref:Pleckstrin homology domain-containing family F member 2 n=1 Tax=Calicophoron daubneyi TaxID=300641 RepID=A0AAV2TI10_CALDB